MLIPTHLLRSPSFSFIAPFTPGKALDDIVHGERHATCLLKAQKEVLICIGKLVLKRLHDAKQVCSQLEPDPTPFKKTVEVWAGKEHQPRQSAEKARVADPSSLTSLHYYYTGYDRSIQGILLRVCRRRACGRARA